MVPTQPSTFLTSLETERLCLRPLRANDLDHLLALDNDPQVMRWLNGGQPVTRVVMANELMPEFLQEAIRHPGFGFWVAEEKHASAFLGWFSLLRAMDERDAPTFGVRLSRDAWGQNYAYEGGKAVLQHAFNTLALRSVEATTYEANTASRRLLARLGFTEIRRFRYTSTAEIRKSSHVADDAVLWPGEDILFRAYSERLG
jgi:RimJ/RimL family protein N-acetyltransferase